MVVCCIVCAHYKLHRFRISCRQKSAFFFTFHMESWLCIVVCGWNGCRCVFPLHSVIIPRIMFWYYKLLALRPNWIAFIVFSVCSVCIFVSLILKEVPDFTDPALVCGCFFYAVIHTLLLAIFDSPFWLCLGFWIAWNGNIKSLNCLA